MMKVAIKNRLQNLRKLIQSYLYSKRKYNILFWKGTQVIVNKSASIEVKGICEFNKPHRPPYRKTCISKAMFYLGYGAKFSMKGFSTYQGTSIYVFDNAQLTLGEGGYLNMNSKIKCWNSITIGKHVVISDDVEIRDCDNHTIIRDGYETSAPIVIEDNVWIGVRSLILKGVTIGEGSIVAAGSVVTKSCPPHSLIAGVPARVIKENVEWK